MIVIFTFIKRRYNKNVKGSVIYEAEGKSKVATGEAAEAILLRKEDI